MTAKKTTSRSRSCIWDATKSLGHGHNDRLNELIDRLCEENYITGQMAEDIQSLVWQAIYEERKENCGTASKVKEDS